MNSTPPSARCWCDTPRGRRRPQPAPGRAPGRALGLARPAALSLHVRAAGPRLPRRSGARRPGDWSRYRIRRARPRAEAAGRRQLRSRLGRPRHLEGRGPRSSRGLRCDGGTGAPGRSRPRVADRPGRGATEAHVERRAEATRRRCPATSASRSDGRRPVGPVGKSPGGKGRREMVAVDIAADPLQAPCRPTGKAHAAESSEVGWSATAPQSGVEYGRHSGNCSTSPVSDEGAAGRRSWCLRFGRVVL